MDFVSSSDRNPYQPINGKDSIYGAEVLLIPQLNPLRVPNTKLKADIFLGCHEVIMTKREGAKVSIIIVNPCIIDMELQLCQVNLTYHFFGIRKKDSFTNPGFQVFMSLECCPCPLGC